MDTTVYGLWQPMRRPSATNEEVLQTDPPTRAIKMHGIAANS